MEDVCLNSKSDKALIVNLSSIHELNYQTTVLNAIAGLESSYPLNLPKHAYDFAAGKYDQIINDYKTGRTNTDQFISSLIQTTNLTFDEKYFSNMEIDIDDSMVEKNQKKEQIKKSLMADAWNKLIDLDDNDANNTYCFFASPKPSCRQKVQKLLDFSNQVNFGSIYFISNTNPLNVHKILAYLSKKFKEIVDPDVVNTILASSEEILDQNRDIKISQNNQLPEIYLALSYRYQAFKTGLDNQRIGIPTTPDLLNTLCTKLNHNGIQNENLFLISQYDKDLEEAATLGIISFMNANGFYNNSDDREKEKNVISEGSSLLR